MRGEKEVGKEEVGLDGEVGVGVVGLGDVEGVGGEGEGVLEADLSMVEGRGRRAIVGVARAEKEEGGVEREGGGVGVEGEEEVAGVVAGMKMGEVRERGGTGTGAVAGGVGEGGEIGGGVVEVGGGLVKVGEREGVGGVDEVARGAEWRETVGAGGGGGREERNEDPLPGGRKAATGEATRG